MATRYYYATILALVLFVAVALRIWDPSVVAQLRFLSFDTFQRLDPRAYTPDLPVRIVDIDEASLAKIGQWPWPRTVLGELTDKMREAGAASIGFDMVFSEEDRLSPESIAKRILSSRDFAGIRESLSKLPSHDETFAEAVSKGPVIMGFVATNSAEKALPQAKSGMAFAGDDPKLFVPSYGSVAASLTQLQDKATGAGALNWIPEYDQVIRRIPLLVSVGDTLYPSLSIEALRVAQGASTFVVKSSGASGEEAFGQKTGINTIRIGDVQVPTDANGQLWLRFTPSDPRRFISASDILTGSIPADELAGRIILVGTSAAGLFDLRTTPLEPSVPGVEVHAQAIEQMLNQDFLFRPDFAIAAELLYILVIGIIVAILIYKLGALKGAFVGGLAIAAVVAVSWLAFKHLNWLVDPIYPAISLAMVQLAGTVIMYLQTESERNRVRSAFGYYMAPALVEELANNPDKLKLGGETRDVSVLFCDVRGFTTISEGMDAEALTQFINNLFSPLSEIIVSERGTIDKYMGDAIMAFWNAPLDDPEHPRNACKAALQMIECVDGLNRQWGRQARARGTEYQPIRLGVGINTGDCCVGNLGSQMRFDYSAIGDNVNIASRLEGETKGCGVSIIAAEPTKARVEDFAWLEVGRIKVKGRNEPIKSFALIGDSDYAQTNAFSSLRSYHMKMLEAIEGENWDLAREFSASCKAIGDDAHGGLYDHYDTLIKERQ